MNFHNGKRFLLLSVFYLLFGFSQIISLKYIWRPVTPAELQMKTPKVEADADAEAIFWEVGSTIKNQKTSYNHYVRVKIFTERGREKFSKFDIPFIKGRKIEDVAARVIKPDGTIIEFSQRNFRARNSKQKSLRSKPNRLPCRESNRA